MVHAHFILFVDRVMQTRPMIPTHAKLPLITCFKLIHLVYSPCLGKSNPSLLSLQLKHNILPHPQQQIIFVALDNYHWAWLTIFSFQYSLLQQPILSLTYWESQALWSLKAHRSAVSLLAGKFNQNFLNWSSLPHQACGPIFQLQQSHSPRSTMT